MPSTPSLPLEDPDTAKAPAERRKNGYTLPPVTLLDAPKDHRKIDERELMDAARLLEEKCREFDVEGQVVQIHPGPVVTTYEFKPDAGVKYSRITGLADDLCLAMQAESVLIDRIPGKSTVGIQIPNPVREGITLRELLESDTYTRSASKLTMALGKTIHGEPFVSDLATMPHLLIAGSTGAGKSVSVNAMVSSILFRSTPEDVRFIMIDPKRLELGMYEDIPHLLTPVVVDTKQAANALQWAVREMEERYKTLAASGVRNIEQYNRNVRAAMLERGKADKPEGAPELKTMPYVIVIIDELADLMMAAGKEVEESIARLAQMARAVGIHLILATQRPSVDVITGLIKANLPARIAFRVASKIDSRTILDGNGAEQLLGKGDMLYLPPASSRFVRIHGPYISEQETARLCSFLRKQGKPIYDVTITAEDKPTEKIEFEKDELFDEAARIVVSSGQASISYLQRRLRIGFSRAARLDRHDGNGRHRLPGGQRQAGSPRRPALLRGSGCATEIAHARTISSTHSSAPRPGWRACFVLTACVLWPAGSRAQTQAATLLRAGASRRADGPGRLAHVAGQLAQGREDVREPRAAVSDERVCRQRALAGGRTFYDGVSDVCRWRRSSTGRAAAEVAEAGVSVEPVRQARRRRAPGAGTSARGAAAAPSAPPPAPEANTPPASPPVPTTLPASGPAAVVKGITESALPHGERITIEFSKEVAFTGRPRREPGPRVLRLRQRDGARVAHRSRRRRRAARSSRRCASGGIRTT